MTTLNLSSTFNTTHPIDAIDIYHAMFSASHGGMLCIGDIPYNIDDTVSYRCTMTKNWGKEDDAVVFAKITSDSIDKNGLFANECELRLARVAKLEEIGAPEIVVNNERFFLSVSKILNCYADEVEQLGTLADFPCMRGYSDEAVEASCVCKTDPK